MKKLVLLTLVISNIAYAGVCENGHYVEHEKGITYDYGVSEKCANIALAERDVINALTQEVSEEEFEKIQRKQMEQKKEKDLGDFLMGIFLE